MIAVLFIFLGGSVALYIISMGKYKEQIKEVDKKHYPLKDFLPLGFLILDSVKYQYCNKYDRKLFFMLEEIYGIKEARFYLKAHLSHKIIFVLLGLILISFTGVCTQPDTTFGIFSICLICMILYLTDRELKERIKRRRFAIRMDFPEFLNKLTLLINAGMTVSKAWERAASSSKGGPLYEELKNTVVEIKAGKSEYRAYEGFSKRCKTPEITRVVSIIIQNLKKGGTQIVSILRVHSNECWEMRKNAARKHGEEASTKMLLPLTLMLLAILLIVATPAVLAMRGM